MSTLLGDITPKEFLRDYWQKKPLLVRGAFTDFEMPFDAGELAGLACEMDTPARILVEHGLAPENKPWTVKHPPFEEEDFTSLPETHWSFLVNDIERYYPELGNLIEPFRFIPDWRIDDLMVSYAADQGSVGPHVDEYDVFLIQGEGKRHWRIITDPNYPKALNPEASLAILNEFKHDEEWVLDKGDMLYLPPNMPHYGVAQGECFTFSVGFRAPHSMDLAQSWIESFTQNTGKQDTTEKAQQALGKRFTDAERRLQKNSGEIALDDIQKLSEQILSLVENQTHQLPIFLGKYLTEVRGTEIAENEGIDTLEIHDNADYERECWVRIAYIESEDMIHLFANGEHLELSIDHKEAIQAFCEHYYYSADSLKSLFKIQNFRKLFENLLNTNSIFPC